MARVTLKSLQSEISTLKDQLNKKELENVKLTVQNHAASSLESSFQNIADHFYDKGMVWDSDKRIEVLGNTLAFTQADVLRTLCWAFDDKMLKCDHAGDKAAREVHNLYRQRSSAHGQSNYDRKVAWKERLNDQSIALQNALEASEEIYSQVTGYTYQRKDRVSFMAELDKQEQEAKSVSVQQDKEMIKRAEAAGIYGLGDDPTQTPLWSRMNNKIQMLILAGDPKAIEWWRDAEKVEAWIAKQDAKKEEMSLQTDGVATSDEQAQEIEANEGVIETRTDSDPALRQIASEGYSTKVA